ncbi:hypothetical protein Pst134EA_013695 [Puccinia striiformis f. sp. tritici]|uniref:hypothetical protein n=1 Tax=Puccinia striiformis f. sp. tritici TaxID=168172 RepID=UPI0020080398|nr:hypothetical protein Pst134EA_013695 [Puccinia striiformis f. sp. tritici]KAH9465830.1 hypothetical protein Pst134EA_013695 [Puccinia striiformis f. sp. tritici]
MPMHPVSNICGSQDDSCLVPSMQMISLLLLISLCSTSVACGAIIDRAVKTLTEAGDVDAIQAYRHFMLTGHPEPHQPDRETSEGSQV